MFQLYYFFFFVSLASFAEAVPVFGMLSWCLSFNQFITVFKFFNKILFIFTSFFISSVKTYANKCFSLFDYLTLSLSYHFLIHTLNYITNNNKQQFWAQNKYYFENIWFEHSSAISRDIHSIHSAGNLFFRNFLPNIFCFWNIKIESNSRFLKYSWSIIWKDCIFVSISGKKNPESIAVLESKGCLF